MAIHSPEKRIWWNEPLDRKEIIWIAIAFTWGLVMFATMIVWHITGQQNLSNEAYRIDPEVYAERTEAMVEQYTVGEEGDTGVPVVHPPPGSDVYYLARLWEWWPVLELEKGQSYRLQMVLTITPNEAGVFSVVCNEFCGIGHHAMVGRIRVVE